MNEGGSGKHGFRCAFSTTDKVSYKSRRSSVTVSKTSKYIKGVVQNTIYGKVRGYEANEGKTLIWKGIPYAQAPVGALRWKAPQNSDKWNGILNATKNGNITIQFKKSRGKVIGNEDCPSTVEHLKIIKN
jgi:hypothetical protein